MLLKENILIGRILIITILYILQGFIQGFKATIPLFLVSYEASWKQQGTFTWVSYPFSFKILWAPIIDSIYYHRFGRHLTWLIPIQIIIGIILIILSFYFEYFLVNLRIVTLTIIFFFMYFLIASQDIVVDGWSISLFASSNLQWSSTSQTIGQVIGQFLGSTVLLTLESSNFTNKYIRKPLSLPQRPYGLFSLQQFIFFWGIVFIVVSTIISIIFSFKKPSNQKYNPNLKKKIHTKLGLIETYLAILKLFKKQCIRELSLIIFTFGIGFAATTHMTILTLVEYGIPRDTVALFNIPLIVVHVFVPLYMSETRRPLTLFARGYIPRLIGSLILAIYIFFTPQTLHKSYFYPVLIVLLSLNDAIIYMMIASRVGFYARISESQIAGTYMTLLATISNLGQSILLTLVFYIANWLPKSHAYFIEVGGCFLLGLMWIGFFWNTIKRLDRLPAEEWNLESSVDVNTITIEYKPIVKVS